MQKSDLFRIAAARKAQPPVHTEATTTAAVAVLAPAVPERVFEKPRGLGKVAIGNYGRIYLNGSKLGHDGRAICHITDLDDECVADVTHFNSVTADIHHGDETDEEHDERIFGEDDSDPIKAIADFYLDEHDECHDNDGRRTYYDFKKNRRHRKPTTVVQQRDRLRSLAA